MSPEEFLLKEITEKLSEHRMWSSRDFSILQILLWASILASAISAFLATLNANKWLIAFLAAIPALAITVESTFHFSERYKYHDQWVIELEEMQRKVRVEKTDPQTISAELSNFQKGIISKFPTSTFPGKEQEKTDLKPAPSASKHGE
ncbi:hypothetical protein [Methylomonas sp. AM2-LC]|uniref:hypothetical protein n=1 Tax=Methylomonas sp. AM2-LC TaxID=3153301 RepID=UPI00326485E4